MSDKEKLLHELSKYHFAQLETDLYLDTHPKARKALAARETYRQKYACLKAEYEKQYGPLSQNAAETCESAWTWVNDPWPWE